MAYAVEILEDDDVLTEDLFARPIDDWGGFTERPDNYYDWKPISEVIGNVWFRDGDIKVGDLLHGHVALYFEFMRKCSR